MNARRRQAEPRLDQADISSRRRTLRRRRVVKTFARIVMWGLIVVAVFVLGLGFGRVLSESDSPDGKTATITRDRGKVTATLPTQTIVRTETVVKTTTKTVKVPARATKSTSSSAN